MQHFHVFLHSNEPDQNEPKLHYWVKKRGLGAFVSFLARNGALLRYDPNGYIKCNPGMVFRTVTKLSKTNQNITIGSKHVDWVCSFRFWPETVHRFVNGPNECIKCNQSMVFCTITKLNKTTQNNTIGSKKVDWVRSFRFWAETVHPFVNVP